MCRSREQTAIFEAVGFDLNVMIKEFIRDQAVQFVCVAGGDSRDAGG